MSEAKARGGGLDSAVTYEDFESHVLQLQDDLTWLEDHGSKAECLHAIEALEGLTSSADYKKACLSYQVEKEFVRDHEDRGVNLDDQTRGAASSVAVARKQSPKGFRNYLVNCRVLMEDTPNLATAFSRGEFTEAHMFTILNELQTIKAQRRTEFDELFAANPNMFEGMGRNRIKDTVRNFILSFNSDPVSKDHKTVEERRFARMFVDKETGCVKLSAQLPLISGMGLKNYIYKESRKLKRKGDERTLDQIRADLLTGYMVVDAPSKTPINLQVGVIMTDRALFQGEREPAFLEGYGYMPAQEVREWISGHQIVNELTFEEMEAKLTPEHIEQIEVRTELARIYTAPGDQDLIAMDSKARIFPEKLKKFIRVRDRHCRTPFCDGIVEEADHVKQYARGGKTSVWNRLGRCEVCNKAKEATGWYEFTMLKGPHSMLMCPGSSTTYKSTAPPATGYVHKSFPQLMADSNWFKDLKSNLNPPRSPDTKAA
ncbi:HNH endonuclease [Glutamicibacter sp. JC586]|uniref:HNH endonuclease n=1 Tax=Glutamicibacter sp. JC586 TaxID=2590552 RepID=UPI00135A1CE9|nr:HNH endonuclease signature motif containing protein [Glutamicibacter sp. JC586]